MRWQGCQIDGILEKELGIRMSVAQKLSMKRVERYYMTCFYVSATAHA